MKFHKKTHSRILQNYNLRRAWQISHNIENSENICILRGCEELKSYIVNSSRSRRKRLAIDTSSKILFGLAMAYSKQIDIIYGEILNIVGREKKYTRKTSEVTSETTKEDSSNENDIPSPEAVRQCSNKSIPFIPLDSSGAEFHIKSINMSLNISSIEDDNNKDTVENSNSDESISEGNEKEPIENDNDQNCTNDTQSNNSHISSKQTYDSHHANDFTSDDESSNGGNDADLENENENQMLSRSTLEQRLSTIPEDSENVSSQRLSTIPEDSENVSSQRLSTIPEDSENVSSQRLSTIPEHSVNVISQRLSTMLDDNEIGTSQRLSSMSENSDNGISLHETEGNQNLDIYVTDELNFPKTQPSFEYKSIAYEKSPTLNDKTNATNTLALQIPKIHKNTINETLSSHLLQSPIIITKATLKLQENPSKRKYIDIDPEGTEIPENAKRALTESKGSNTKEISIIDQEKSLGNDQGIENLNYNLDEPVYFDNSTQTENNLSDEEVDTCDNGNRSDMNIPVCTVLVFDNKTDIVPKYLIYSEVNPQIMETLSGLANSTI